MEKYGKLYPLGHWVLPIKMKGNAYFGGSVASAHEPEAKVYAEEGITFEFSEEMDKVYDEYHTQNGLANNSIKMQQALIDGDFSYEKEGRDLYNYMRYKTLMDVGKTEQAKELYVSEKDAQKALDAVYSAMANTAQGKKEYNLAKGDGAKPTLETLWKMYRYDGDRSKIGSVAESYNTYNAYNDKLSEKMSYKELAELLYGKK